MSHSVKITDEDYKKLKYFAERSHRTISGTISHMIATSGLFVEPNAKQPKAAQTTPKDTI